MKLSILIPTLNEPQSIAYLKRLRGILDPQIARYPNEVEIKIHDAGRHMPTGTKRNELIANSEGEYFSQIDCDDVPSGDYVLQLMKGISMGVDVVTFNGYMTTNGGHRQDFTIKLGSAYEQWGDHFYRWPNHLCCFKRSVVDKVKFPPLWNQEDYIWSKEIRDKKLLKTSYHIDKVMYIYDFRTNKPSYGSVKVRR